MDVINLFDIYAHMCRRAERVIENNKLRIVNFENLINRCTTEINDNKSFVEAYSNFLEIGGLKRINGNNLTKLYWRKSEIPQSAQHKVSRIEVVLKNFVNAKEEVDKLHHSNSKAKATLLSMSDGVDILRRFNECIIDEMIRTGYKFFMPYGLGDIFIKRQRVKRPKVNWNESNKRREEIIENGETPYKEGVNDDGKKWLVFYDDDYEYHFRWHKEHVFVENQMFFCFRPNRGAHGTGGAVSKLHQYIKHNPLVVHKYIELNF